jgi:modulator of FtsH protease HflK
MMDEVAQPPPPPGPIAQSVVIGFRAIYVATLLLVLAWLASNFREIAPDSQAVVLRFGRIVRAQQAGLLIAWPRPIDQVRLLPGPDRQLSQDVGALPAESSKAEAVIAGGGTASLPPNVAAYLTGDGNVVLLNATLIYRINDPLAFALAESHVPSALDRVFRAATVRVTAGRNLNDFLVVQNNAASAADGEANAQAITALRSEVRSSLLQALNARLQQLAADDSPLGIEVQRIDMTAWLPSEAKTAFDAVLTATQAADRGVAVARTDAERRRQEAERERGRLQSAAQATAKELVASANVDTARIIAIEREETPQTRTSLLLRAYRADIGDIMNRVGSVTLIDPQSGVRFVLPGKQK